jgi:hypothetical protein
MTVFQYDDLGFEDAYGFESDTAYGLVKFSAQQNTQLISIGLFVVAENQSVEIEVYDNFDGVNLTGLLGNIMGTATYPGYYTFALNNTIDLPGVNDFYVKVKYVAPGTAKPIAIENGPTATIETGKYWIKKDESYEWQPIGEGTEFEFDLCIKAYGNVASQYFTANSNVALQSDYVSSNEIKVYPNPAQDYITISGLNATKSTQISILTINGVVIKCFTCNNEVKTISLNNIPPGLYFMKTDGEMRKHCKLFIIN